MTRRTRGSPMRGVATAAVVLALAGCSGDDTPPSPTGAGTTGAVTADSGSATTAAWSAKPVWEGTVTLRQAPAMPVTMRLYPLQRIDGRVLLTVEYTPQGAQGQSMAVSPGAFCYRPSCLTMESVSLVDPVGLVRLGPLVKDPQGTAVVGSVERWNEKKAGVTYRFGVFFADPGTDTATVDLVSAGAVPGVPIAAGGETAPGLVVDDAAGASPVPEIETTTADDVALVTVPVRRPPVGAGDDRHPLVAPIVGGEVTDYTGAVNLNADVLFAFNSASLSAKAKTLIAQAAQKVRAKADPTRPLLVTGHTDNVGGTAYNQRLSTQRAQAVAAALEANPATAAWQMTVAGKGEREPVAAYTTPDGKDDPAGRALNRRVEIAYTPKPAATPSPSPVTSTGSAAGGGSAPATISTPTPVATLGPAEMKSSVASPGRVTVRVAPVQVTGALALVRFTLQPEGDLIITDALARTRASTDLGAIRLTDGSTKVAYLAAHDEGDEDRVTGTEIGQTATAGRTYSAYVYTAAPPAGSTSITLSMGQLGTVTVPVQR